MPDQPADLTIGIQLRVSDIRWALLLYGFRTPMLILFGFLIAVGVVGLVFGDSTLVYFAAFAIFCNLALPFVQALIQGRNPMMRTPFRHTFSENGISSEFKGGNLRLDWDQIKKVSESNQYLAVWGMRGTPMLIPVDQITPDELNSLRAIFGYYLREKASLRKSPAHGT